MLSGEEYTPEKSTEDALSRIIDQMLEKYEQMEQDQSGKKIISFVDNSFFPPYDLLEEY